MTIFIDLDGTIINSFDRHYLLLENILKKYEINKKINIDEFKSLKRNGYNNLYYLENKLLIDKEKSNSIQREWILNIENSEWLKYDKLYDDSIDFLESIKNNKNYYLTARTKKENVKEQLKNLKINDYVEGIFVVDSKNAIENKMRFIEEYKKKNPKEKIIIIGDTEVEYETAINNNISYYILNRGFRSDAFLKCKNVNYTYKNLKEIKEVLLND